jgi:L-fucose mutarotase
MLKGIPKIIPPKLMMILMEMGHGDEIVIGDGNYPASSSSKRLVRCDGHEVIDILDVILQFFPLDTFVDKPVTLMSIVEGDDVKSPPIWDEYRKIVKKHHNNFNEFNFEERFDFYRRSKESYAVIATSDQHLYANVILKKGIIK